MFSYFTPWISIERRVVIATSPLPKRSAASAIARCSSVVILPPRVITRTLKTSSNLLSLRQPKALTRIMSAGVNLLIVFILFFELFFLYYSIYFGVFQGIWGQNVLPMHISRLSECEHSISTKLAPGEFLRIHFHPPPTQKASAKQMPFVLSYGTICDDFTSIMLPS